jgi:non-heme chloroperoxidase
LNSAPDAIKLSTDGNKRKPRRKELSESLAVAVFGGFEAICSSNLNSGNHKRHAMKLEKKFLDLPGRLKVEYVEQGSSDGVPVIMLHGLTDSWYSFTPVFPFLPESLHAFAFSQRGHGDSERPQSGYTPKDFADDVAAFMDVKGIRRAVLVGHSMGSFMTQRFAIDYPERTAAIVLIGSFASLGDKEWAKQFLEDVLRLNDPVPREFALEFQKSTIQQPVPPEFLERIVNESLKVPARVWKCALKEGHIDVSHAAELQRINAPTLIVWGDRDTLIDRTEQDFLVSQIRRADFVAYEGVGHAVHWEAPQRFANDLAGFVDVLQLNESSREMNAGA